MRPVPGVPPDCSMNGPDHGILQPAGDRVKSGPDAPVGTMKRGDVSWEVLLEPFQRFPIGNTHGATAPGMALLRGRPGSAIADPATAAPGPGPLPGISGLWPGRTCPGRDVEVGENGEDGASRPVDRPLPFTSAWQICQQYPGHKSLSWHSGSVLSTLGGEGENPEGFRPGGIRGRLLSRKPVPGSPTVQGRRLRRLPCPGESPSGTCSGKGGEETWQKSRQTVW